MFSSDESLILIILAGVSKARIKEIKEVSIIEVRIIEARGEVRGIIILEELKKFSLVLYS